MKRARKKNKVTTLVNSLKLPEIPFGSDIDLSNKGGLCDDRPWYRITDAKSNHIRGSSMVTESTLNYYFFCLWIMLPPPVRSFEAVSGLNEKQIGRRADLKVLKKIAYRYSWKVRSDSYDDFLMNKRLDANQKSVEQMNDYYAALSRKLVDVYMIPYEALAQKIQQDPKFIEALVEKPTLTLLSAMNSFTKSITELMKMERLSRGVSTSNVANKSQVDVNVNIHDFKTKLKAVEERLASEGDVIDI